MKAPDAVSANLQGNVSGPVQAAESSPPATDDSSSPSYDPFSERDESSFPDLENYQHQIGQLDESPLEATRQLHSRRHRHVSYNETLDELGNSGSGNGGAADRLSDRSSFDAPAGATADTISSKAGRSEHLEKKMSFGTRVERGFADGSQDSSFTTASFVPAVPALPAAHALLATSTQRSTPADKLDLSSFAASLLPDKGQSRAGPASEGSACTARDDAVPLAPPSPELSPDRSAIPPPGG